jgi:sensor histidine kinase regulating citrate/malate metabolism
MTISLCYKLTNLANAEMEQRLRIQRIEMEAKLNEDLSDIINTLRSLRHDMNNHIGIMKGLVENSEYVLLQQYLHDIYSEITNANDFIFVSNQALLILLNSKISKAQQKNIEMENIIEVNEIKISDKDMCSLLGNIIDNAIEAAEKNTDNSYIKLEIKENANCCYIYCENTYSQKPNLKNGKFITFKPDSINHGIGTENIKSIVKKYNGTINYNIDELFSVHILIPYDKKPC